MQAAHFEIVYVESEAYGRPRLVCRVNFLAVGGRNVAGSADVINRDQDGVWQEHHGQIAADLGLRIYQDLLGLAAFERTLRVTGVFDTSEVHSTIVFLAASDTLRQSHCSTFGTAASGIEGVDAPAFETLLKKLFRLAGYEGTSAVLKR